MGFTPIDIENQKFEVRMRGYDKSQVQTFLAAISEETASLIAGRNLLEEEMASLKKRLLESDAREKKVQETILALRDLTDKMKEDARREGELIVREARLKAETIVEEARGEARRIESQISDLRLQHDTFEDSLRVLIDEHQRILIHRRQETELRGSIPFRKPRTGEAEQ
jgi:cell division initiation protein